MQAPSERIMRIWRNRRGRLLLVLAMALAPLLLWLGAHWKFAHYQTREFSIRTSRARAVELANEFLRSRGFSVPAEWNLEFDEDLEFLNYIHRKVGERAGVPAITQFPSAPASIRLIQAGDVADPVEVTIGPQGRVLSYSFPIPPESSAAAQTSREEAISMARDLLNTALLTPGNYLISDVRVYEQTDSRSRRILRVEWTATSKTHPELAFTLRFGIAGGAVFSKIVSADIDDAYMANAGPMGSLREFINLIAPFYIIGFVVFMMVRYIQRSMEKEVSHLRALVVAAYIMAMVSVIFAANDQNVVFNIELNDDAPGAVIIFIYFFFAVLAVLAGMCYAACEGDVRERFMGSLSAFDALLTGRILSRNVARAFVAGFVGAAWLFCIQVGANLLFEGGVEEPSSLIFVYRMAHAKFPALVVFLMLPVGIGILLTFGLLVPLGVVSRMERLRRAGWPLLVLVAFVNILFLHGGFLTLKGAITILGAEVAILLALIHFIDLLSAYVCIVLASYFNLLTNLQLMTNMSRDALLPMHAVVLATLVTALFLLRSGKEYADEEVRPAYAMVLAERQLLSARLSTAAVAQSQLTRESVPQIEGFSIAVDCRPARIVSGDFYDFFQLGDRTMGALMMGGSGRGLLDAMLIAFAKGFLLEQANSSRNSKEVVVRLLENLGSLLEPGDAFPELCFLTLDSEKNQVAYSRTERFPGIISVFDNGASGFTVRQGSNAEMAVAHTVREKQVSLRSGVIHLRDHASLLLFTRGFERGLKRAGVVDLKGWLMEKWNDIAATDASVTLQKLTAAALGASTLRQNPVPREDLTLMVLHTVVSAASEAERAA